MNLYRRGDTWWCRFWVDKRLFQYSCKTKNKVLAQEIAATLQADVIRENFDIPKKYRVKKPLQAIWEEYLKNLINVSTTLARKKVAAKHFLKVFGDTPVNEITSAMMKEYQITRRLEIILKKNTRVQDISFRSVNIEILTLSHLFNFCIEKGYAEKNPCADIKKLNQNSRLKTLSDSDIKKLIEGAANKLTRDLITFLIYTGCRKGEALNLKWENVDLENGIIAIKGTKTQHDRHIPISNALDAILRAIERPQGIIYVFNRNGVKLTDFKRSFHTACRNAGLKDLRIHDLRHVFASKMVMNGTSLYITGELLGHRTTQMTKRYSHLIPDTLMKAVNDVWTEKKNKDKVV